MEFFLLGYRERKEKGLASQNTGVEQILHFLCSVFQFNVSSYFTPDLQLQGETIFKYLSSCRAFNMLRLTLFSPAGFITYFPGSSYRHYTSTFEGNKYESSTQPIN